MRTVRRELEKAGATVEESETDRKRVTVKFDTEKLSREDLEATMEAVGFPPEEEARDGDGSA